MSGLNSLIPIWDEGVTLREEGDAAFVSLEQDGDWEKWNKWFQESLLWKRSAHEAVPVEQQWRFELLGKNYMLTQSATTASNENSSTSASINDSIAKARHQLTWHKECLKEFRTIMEESPKGRGTPLSP